MEGAPPLDGCARGALVALGTGLIGTGLYFGFVFFVNIVVGLAEPVHPSEAEWALIRSYVLCLGLLFVTGIFSLFCRTRRRLWILGALLAATAAAMALSFNLYDKAERPACLHYLEKQREQAPHAPVDTSCLD
jgi:hypothetical protein